MKKLLTKGWTGPRGIHKGGISTPAANRMVLWPPWDLQVPRTKPDVQLWETPTELQLCLQWRSTGKELGKQTPWPLSSAALQFLSGTLGWLVPTESRRERGPGGTVCGGEPPGAQSSVDERREFYRLSWVFAKLACWRSSPQGMACGDAFGRESSGLDEAMSMQPPSWGERPDKKRHQGFLSAQWGLRDKVVICKPGRGLSTESVSAGALILDFRLQNSEK